MAHITDDRVLESTTTTGTSSLALGGALAGFRSFGSTMSSPSDTCWYTLWAVDGSGNATGDYEEGLGTYSAANTLTRTTVLKSSNSNAVVSLSAGTKYVAISAIASKVLQFDVNGVVPMPIVSANPPAAPTDTLYFYARKISGRVMPKWTPPSGLDNPVQAALFGNNIVMYMPNTGTTVGLNLGTPWVAGGTVSHPTPSSTSPAIVNQMKRTRLANIVTTTNQVLGISSMASGVQQFWRGNAAGLGGFFFFTRFIVELWPAATVRLFAGLSDQTTAVVASDTLAGNLCGLLHITTDAATVLNFVTRNGSSSTSAAITLTGALAAGQAFDFYMYAKPNDSTIYYRLDDVNAGTTLVDSSATATLPTATAFMGPQVHMSNGTANTTVTTTAIGINRIYVESDH
jgi:hypothetical protein